jgi:hypothetical protein
MGRFALDSADGFRRKVMKRKLISFGKGFSLTAAILVAFGLVAPRSAQALFGFTDLQQMVILIQQLNQLKLQVQYMESQIKMAKQNIVALGHKETYRNLLHSTGEIGVSTLNDETYAQARVLLDPGVPGLTESRADVSRISLADDASGNTMQAIRQISQWQTTNRNPLSEWERSVFSNDSKFDSTMAQQNLTNIGLFQLYQQGEANLAVNSSVAQQLALQNMRDRNAEVKQLNFWSDVMKYHTTEGGAWTGAGEFLNSH